MLDLFFFFFNDTATTEIYTLSLHDALPISSFQRWAVEKRKLMGDFELISPGLQCRPRGALGFGLGAVYPIGIVQTPSQFVLLSEQETTYRVIYTDGRPHQRNPEPQFNGDSTAHWEGDTLVVDVVGLETQMWIPGAGGWFASEDRKSTRLNSSH